MIEEDSGFGVKPKEKSKAQINGKGERKSKINELTWADVNQ